MKTRADYAAQADFHAGAGDLSLAASKRAHRAKPNLRTELTRALTTAERGWSAVGMGGLMALALGMNHHDALMIVSGLCIGTLGAVETSVINRRLTQARRQAA